MTEAVTDATIADFRAANGEALNSAAHPLHSQRLGELSALYDQRFAAPAEIAAPSMTAEEHRVKHEIALNDRAHADHDVRTKELTAIHQRDAVEGENELGALVEPPASPDAYDFSKAKQMVPYGSELEPNPEFEKEVRGTFFENKVTPSEANIIANRYMEAQRLGFVPTTPEQAMEGLRGLHGEKADEVVHAIRRVVGEIPNHMLEMLEANGLANDPFIITALTNVAKRKGYL